MGSFSPLSDTLRGFPAQSNVQTVIHNLVHHPAFPPGAIIASQTLFFGVQAIAIRRQLRHIKSSAYTPPLSVDGESQEAPIHTRRIRQRLMTSLISYGTSLGLAGIRVFGGWNALWKTAVNVGQWYSQTFGSTRPYLVANPVFFLLDTALSLAVSGLFSNLYLAYNSSELYPQTANLSFLGRLKAQLSRSWNTSTPKMWFFKTFASFMLPALTITPGMMIAAQIQYKFENGMYGSTAKAIAETFGAGLLTLALVGAVGASLPFFFFNDEDLAKKGGPMPTSRTVPRCPLEDLEERGIQLKGKDKGSSLDSTSVEKLVADVVKDTDFQDTVDILIGLDTDPEFADTSLRFLPCRLEQGSLLLSQRQLEIFDSSELKAMIARALLPGMRKPFDFKTSLLNFLTVPLPLLIDPGMYWLFRKTPWLLDGMIPSWRAHGAFIPFAIYTATMQALVPWSVYSISLGANVIAKQVYSDDQRIASISPEYARGWAGVLRKHKGVYLLVNDPEGFICDYGSMDPFFEKWYGSHGMRSEGPTRVQRLEKLPIQKA